MKQKIKKVFENAVWWSGVVMVGLVLGLTIQFVKAWTEPTVAPPNGNVGAPINTGPIGQFKQGVLQVLGLTVFNDPAVSGVDVTGKVLTAQNANGAVGWAAGGGVSFTYYCYGPDPHWEGSSPHCTDAGGSHSQHYCPAGFTQILDLGAWGTCCGGTWGGSCIFVPPGTSSNYGSCGNVGRAYICSK